MRQKKIFIFCVAVLSFLFFISCKADKKKPERRNTYSQEFKTDIAWVVLEWNGKPKYGGWGSAFLADKKSGTFFTNKHVSDKFDSLGKGSQKIFFNGRVYDLTVLKTPPLADVAVVKIDGPFDFSDFPEPASLAGEKVKKGDKVVVEGFHPHPYFVRKGNELEEGYNEKPLSIFKDYYNMGTKNLEKEIEIVFERIDGVVEEVDVVVPVNLLDGSRGIINRTREIANRYIKIRTDKDHKFSFGGLSGTAVRNLKRETVGIFTLEFQGEFEMQKDASLEPVFKTTFATPIQAVKLN